MQKEIALLEARIGYQFNQKALLREAMTHSSYANELRAKSKKTVQCNERLEFLGDAVLEAIVSEYLFKENRYLPVARLDAPPVPDPQRQHGRDRSRGRAQRMHKSLAFHLGHLVRHPFTQE